MREKYETLSLATLKELAKGRGMRGISTLKKGELIEAMLLQDEKDAANKDIAATPSVTRREKATVVRGRRPSASEQEKAKADAGTVPEAGKAETAGTSEERDTASAEGQTGAAAADEWQSVRGDTQTSGTSGNRTWNNPARRMNATPRPENAPERGRRNGMQQGRTYVARTQQNADSSEQPRVGRVQRNYTERSNYAGTGSTRPVSAMAANEEHTREAAQSEPRMNREEHIPSEPSGAVPVVAGTNPEQESRSDRPPADIQQLDSGQEVSGILEMVEGYGFLRRDNYMPGENDIYVSPVTDPSF